MNRLILIFINKTYYSETLEISWNIELNRIQPNKFELVRSNRNFSIFRCWVPNSV
jgi:hypothetical protein